MLTSIGRAAIRRTGLKATASTKRGCQSIWQLQQLHSTQCKIDVFSSVFLSRAFATATKTAPKPTSAKAKSSTTKTAKKPAKKAAASKKPGPKATAKKPAKRPAKKPAKKPATKRRGLTQIQKDRLKKSKDYANLVALKETALLSTPKQLPASAYLVFATDNNLLGGGPAALGGRSKEAAAQYKNLSPAEIEVRQPYWSSRTLLIFG